MKNILNSLVYEVNNRDHLSTFLKGVDIHVQLSTITETAYITIIDGQIKVEETTDKPVTNRIEGTKEVMELLLLGELKLREAQARKILTVQISFRSALYLETLFILSKPYTKVS